MKRLSLLILATSFSVVSTSFAAQCGFYLGAGGGYGILRTPNQNVFNVSRGTATSNSHDRGGAAGRLFLGYNFIRFFGLEAGVARYPQSKYEASMNGLHSKLTYDLYGVDLVAKGYLPLFRCFNIYGLAGAGHFNERVHFEDGGIPVVGIKKPHDDNDNINKFRALYGLGVSYDYHHFTAGLEATRMHKYKAFSRYMKVMPYADLLTFNISYHFG